MLKLKEATAPHHDQVEQNRYAKAIMSNTLTMEHYRIYLEKFYTFILPLEQQWQSRPEWSSLGFDIGARLHSPRLEQDLLALGLSVAELKALPVCSQLPDVSTFERTLGCMYVLEGSMLGGQMITRKLQSYLPVDPDHNLHYFNGYGADTRQRWQQFGTLLNEQVSGEDADRQTLEAAVDTFVQIGQWLERPIDDNNEL
jgi:heme oxygenase